MQAAKKRSDVAACWVAGVLHLAVALGLFLSENGSGTGIIGDRLFGFQGGGFLLLSMHGAAMSSLVILGVRWIRMDHRAFSVGNLKILPALIFISHTLPDRRVLAMQVGDLRVYTGTWLLLSALTACAGIMLRHLHGKPEPATPRS